MATTQSSLPSEFCIGLFDCNCLVPWEAILSSVGEVSDWYLFLSIVRGGLNYGQTEDFIITTMTIQKV
jgi:hypothetical protein